MVYLECPLCCAENFTDEFTLRDHLLNLSDNIICPICELQFKTIRSLAAHLVTECNQSHLVSSEDESKDSVSKEHGVTRNFDVPKEQTVHKVVESESLKVLGRVIDESNVSSKANNERDAEENLEKDSSTRLADSQELSAVEDCSPPEEVVDKGELSELENVIPKETEDSLFTCSVCNTTFTSIQNHLEEFHAHEHVLIDSFDEFLIEDQEGRGLPNDEEMKTVGITEDLLENVSTSVIWTPDDISMLENWHSDQMIQGSEAPLINEANSHQSFLSCSASDESRWILSSEGYYYTVDETKAQDVDERSTYSKSVTETAVSAITTDSPEQSTFDLWNDWPEDIKKLPLATFVTVHSDSSLLENEDEPILTQENKPYLFQEHRVRLVTVKGGRDGLPTIEEIPFPDKPPDSLTPVLEPAVNVPLDLVGTFAVMWPCSVCDVLELHWSSLANHKCAVVEFSENQCSICSMTFQSKRALNVHCNAVHVGSRPLNGKYQCTLCPAVVQSSSHLEKHLAMHKKNDLMKCFECGSMVQKSTFEQHVLAHQKNGTLHLVCFMCNRPFKGEEELAIHVPQCHLQEKGTDVLQCTICQDSCSSLAALREHLVTHNIPIRAHCCTYCPKSFHRLIDKVVHERVHTKSKPHECEACGRCFRLRNSLMTHMRIHTGEKPYPCVLCEKAFRTKHLLRTHMTTHSDQADFKCKFCPKLFKCKERARIHENKHKKPYSCSECSRAFHSLSFMKKHMENHKKGNLLFSCTMCPQMFTRAAYLETHLAGDHGLDHASSISISTQKTYEQMNMKACEQLTKRNVLKK